MNARPHGDETGHTEPALLLDCRGISDALGVSRHVAEGIMAELVKVRLGHRVFVYREHVLRHVKEREVR